MSPGVRRKLAATTLETTLCCGSAGECAGAQPRQTKSYHLISERGIGLRLLLTVIAAVLYAIGWCAGAVSLLVVWCWTALAVGWDDARNLGSRERRDEPVRAR